MAQTLLVRSSSNLTSGAVLDGLSDSNALTLTGVGLGCITVGGAAFVAAAVVPSYILPGVLLSVGCLVGGHYVSDADSVSDSDDTVTVGSLD